MCFTKNILGYKFLLPSEKKKDETRRVRLTNIIRYAHEHCPFYNAPYAEFLTHEPSFSDEEFTYAFAHLPIIDKSHIYNYNHAFCSDEIAEKPELSTKTKPISSLKILKKALINKQEFATSLSLGGTPDNPPLYRWLNTKDAKLFANSVLKTMEQENWKRGKPFVLFMPKDSAFINILTHNQKALKRLFGLHIVPYEHITEETVERLLTTLKKSKAKAIFGVPEALLRTAQIMHESGAPPYRKLSHITISGSFFLDCNKTLIQTMFPNSNISCTYGATECGMIARQSGLNSFNYDVLSELAYLEQGPDNTILITTYNQKAFPLIRYKLEDMGHIINNENGTQTIKSLEGSNTQYLIGADGYMYFPSFFNMFINELNDALNNPITDFTARYTHDTLKLGFVLNNPEKESKIEETVQNILKPVFANYEHITVTFPPHIPHTHGAKPAIIMQEGAPPRMMGGYFSSLKQEQDSNE